MHFYNFNVSNYQAHTSHLDNLEDLAYRRMLDYCYFHEEPLPKDVKQIAKLIRMRDECERIADVLQEFFIDEEEGYFHSKVNAEIDRYRTKSEKAKASAKARWDRKTLKNKVLGSDANALRTDCEGNAKEELRTKKEERVNTKREAIPYQLIADAYNDFANRTDNPLVVKITNPRKAAIKKLWLSDIDSDNENQQTNNIEYWVRYFDHCTRITFLNNSTEKTGDHANWRPDFDFMMKEKTYIGIREGKYS